MIYYNSVTGRELSERQIEIVKLIAHGLGNKQIARSLKISMGTIREHISKALEITGMQTRMQLVIWSIKKGTINLDEIKLLGEETV